MFPNVPPLVHVVRKRIARAPLTITEYARRLRAGKRAPDVSLSARLNIADVETKDADGVKTYTFTLSTSTVDRDRDVIAVDGWHTEAFMASGGPVLFGHGFDANGTMPVGRATEIWSTPTALKASMQFITGDPFAERVQRAVDFGALRATSVGFRPYPGRAAWNEERNGIDFLEQELLEFSIVPIPANPEALREKSGTLITSDPAVYLASVEAIDLGVRLAYALGKRGRVLSTANEQRIRAAHGHGSELCSALSEVLAQVEAMDPEDEPEPDEDEPIESDEDEKAIAPAPDPLVVRFAPEPKFQVTDADIRRATERALKDLVTAAVRQLTGRLD